MDQEPDELGGKPDRGCCQNQDVEEQDGTGTEAHLFYPLVSDFDFPGHTALYFVVLKRHD